MHANLGAIYAPKKRSQFSDTRTRIWWLIWKLEKICNKVMERFFQNQYLNWYIIGFKVGQKMQNLTGNYFLLNVCGFRREKIADWRSKLWNWSWLVKNSRIKGCPSASPSKMLTLKCNVSWQEPAMHMIHIKEQN